MADQLRDWLSSGVIIAASEDDDERKTESPIEAMFLRAFYFRASEEIAILKNALGIRILPQERIGKYRVDVLFVRGERKLVVECDGHDFHERTKEQAATDKARDRALLAMGFAVMRFTGSEIWANPFIPAKEAIDYLMGRSPGG